MKILVVEPGKIPYPADVPNTLKAMQSIVGGRIEVVYPYEEAVGVVANEEGLLPFNRRVGDNDSLVPIVGTFFVCGLFDDNFCSLNKHQLKKFTEQLFNPEVPVRCENELVFVKIPAQYSVDQITPYTPKILKNKGRDHER